MYPHVPPQEAATDTRSIYLYYPCEVNANNAVYICVPNL
jgi:hypothetical protein